MRVKELLTDLARKFPNAPIEGWEPEYRAALGPHEGERLGKAYRITMQGWSDYGPPKPAQIAANLAEVEKGRFSDELNERDMQRIGRQRRRADALFATASRECADYLATEWGNHAYMHLLNITRRIAQLEEAGHSVHSALAFINGNDRRIACAHCRPTRTWADNEPMLCPPRAPEAWLDAHDDWIFKARHESHQRANPTGRGLGRASGRAMDGLAKPIGSPRNDHSI